MTVHTVQELSFQREGVRYTIHVEQRDDGAMWGTWHCHDCGTGGSATKSSPDVTHAVEAARDSLEVHHNMYHPTR
jgi:hypothetical protein